MLVQQHPGILNWCSRGAMVTTALSSMTAFTQIAKTQSFTLKRQRGQIYMQEAMIANESIMENSATIHYQAYISQTSQKTFH